MEKRTNRKRAAAVTPNLTVAIAAGAGSQQSLLTILGAMTANSGTALFVIAQDDRFEMTAEIDRLARHTPFTVCEPSPGVLIKTDHVYVVPPHASLGVAEGIVVNVPTDSPQNSRSSINRFLSLLAEDQRGRAAVVVLSGESPDIVSGARAIKSHVGHVVVEEPRSVECPAVLRSVIDADLSDFVVPAAEIPGVLVGLARKQAQQQHGRGTASPQIQSNQKQRNIDLRRVNESLERKVSEQAELIEIVRDVAIASNEAVNVEEAFIYALRRICDYNHWLAGHTYHVLDSRLQRVSSLGIWYINREQVVDEQRLERLQTFGQSTMRRQTQAGPSLVARVLRTAKPCWSDHAIASDDWHDPGAEVAGLTAAIAFPVRVNNEVAAVLECFSDRPIKREAGFMEIMENVGIQLGHVIERKRLEQDLTESVERAQRRIGSDIHDDVGQELTGLRLIAQAHLDALVRAESAETSTARRICDGLQTVQQHMRNIVRQLMPVGLEEESFFSAIESLARRTTQLYGIHCRFDHDQSVIIRDQSAATHLYRITQEAVNNAVKHARCREVTIRLGWDDKNIRLEILDDGQGIDPRKGEGMGTRTMAYRAALIGGKLTIENRPDRSGTSVTCLVSMIHAKAFDDHL